MMMRDAARNGLQSQLDAAVTNGDAEAARKIAKDLETLAVSTAPKTLPYNDVDIKAEMDKQTWFGVDPKKSARAVELGKSLDPKKFATAELFAAALVKAVDEEFKPAGTGAAAGEENDEEDPEDEEEDGEKPDAGEKKPKQRATDGPSDADAGARSSTGKAARGPWLKLSDAPAAVQADINRSMGKLLNSNTPKEQREVFIKNALTAHQRTYKAGKK